MTGQGLRKGLFVPAVFTAVMAALLVSLGVWQLHRLTWKEALIAHVEARATAPPGALPTQVRWPTLAPDDYDYAHVSLDGVWDAEAEALVFRGGTGKAASFGPGYLVLTPLKLASGAYVIVNRGFVPLDMKDRTKRPPDPAGSVHVTGLMRPPETRNLFTPADRPEAGAYFTRDPALIAAHFNLAPAAPFTIDVDATPPGLWPMGGATELSFPNNHFSYALTWFGLALGLIGVFAAYVARLRGWFGRPLSLAASDRR